MKRKPPVLRPSPTVVSLDGYGEFDPYMNDTLQARHNVQCEHLSLHEKIGTFDEPADPFLKSRLPDLVSSLEKRERQVLRLRFEKGLTYMEVGARLKVSRELARQIEQRALERLKAMMTSGEEVES